jgi:hypothetical protein
LTDKPAFGETAFISLHLLSVVHKTNKHIGMKARLLFGTLLTGMALFFACKKTDETSSGSGVFAAVAAIA